MSTSSNERIPFRVQSGLTLMEMILFIVVLGVAGVALLSVLSAPLTGAGTQMQAVTAAQAAQARMEVVLGQKRKAGYPQDPANCQQELDPCDGGGPAELCDEAKPADWAVSTQCEDFGSELRECRVVVVVTATGPGGSAHAVRTLISNLSEPSCG